MGYARGKVNELVADGVSRYLHDVYLARPDLHAAFPDLAGDDGERFLRWAWEWGIDELGLTPELLEPLAGAEGSGTAAGNGAGPPAPRGLSVEALGYFDGNLGLGQAARGYTEALRAAGIPVATRNVTAMIPAVPGRELTERAPERDFERGEEITDAAVSLICLNADQLITFTREEGPVIPVERFRIGVWAWETDTFPTAGGRLPLVDEIWVYSTYVADILAPSPPGPGRARSRCRSRRPTPAARPSTCGLPDGFLFLFIVRLLLHDRSARTRSA